MSTDKPLSAEELVVQNAQLYVEFARSNPLPKNFSHETMAGMVNDLLSLVARLKAEVERQGRLLVAEGEKLLAAESDVRALERKLAEREREIKHEHLRSS